MGIFGKKKDDSKKTDEKSAKSDDAQKDNSSQSMKDLYSNVDTSKKTVRKDSSKTKSKSINIDSQAYRVLIKPLITEKATNLGAQNKYVFEASRQANKIEIAKAVKDIYGVEPIDIRIINVRGKSTRYGRTRGKRRDWKKAIIKLKQGDSIQVYEGV